MGEIILLRTKTLIGKIVFHITDMFHFSFFREIRVDAYIAFFFYVLFLTASPFAFRLLLFIIDAIISAVKLLLQYHSRQYKKNKKAIRTQEEIMAIMGKQVRACVCVCGFEQL